MNAAREKHLNKREAERVHTRAAVISLASRQQRIGHARADEQAWRECDSRWGGPRTPHRLEPLDWIDRERWPDMACTAGNDLPNLPWWRRLLMRLGY